MLRIVPCLVAVMVASVGFTSLATAQAPPPSGKIFCWKGKSGKTECGDAVPMEYQDQAVRELNKRGVTVRKTDAALTPEQKQAEAAERERKLAEHQKREDQRRKDKALLDTFTNEKEIDLKRAREMQLLESNIETLQTNLKNAQQRQIDAAVRVDGYNKRSAAVPQPVQDELARADTDKAAAERMIAQKRKDIAAMNQQYDELKRRFIELKGEMAKPVGTAPAPPAAASAPVAKPAASK